MMKKILSIALVLMLCLTMLVACGKDTKTENNDNKNDVGSSTTAGNGGEGNGTTTENEDDNGLKAADVKASLVSQYQTGKANEPMTLKSDKEVYSSYMGFAIAWSVEITEGAADSVKISDSDKELFVLIDISDSISAAVTFKAIAKISNEDGSDTAEVSFLYAIPGPVADPAADSTLTVKEAAELGASKDHNVYTSNKYYIIATVVEVTDKAYGNMKVKGDDGTTLTIYGSFGPTGNKFNTMDPEPKSGDKVKLYGILGQYNGTAQMKNANIMEVNNKKPGTATTTARPTSDVKEPAANSEVSIADAIAIGLSKESDKYTSNKYYVTGTVVEVYNEQYGNMKIKDDKGNVLTLYGTWSSDGKHRYDVLKTQAKAGDTIKVYGVIGQFGEVAQVKNGWIIAINGKAPEVDASKTTTAPKQDVTVVDPAVGKAYKFGMIQELVSTETVYFLKGGMNGYYMESTNDVKQAIDVYLEETDGGYYMYTMISGKKTYINMVVSGTHVNGEYSETAKTVYFYDKTAKTIKSNIDGRDYWFGTRNDKTYTTIGPCAVDYNGFYCMFYEA